MQFLARSWHRRAAFTLIEVLVIATIIALLAAVLPPSLATAGQAEQRADRRWRWELSRAEMMHHAIREVRRAFADAQMPGVPQSVL